MARARKKVEVEPEEEEEEVEDLEDLDDLEALADSEEEEEEAEEDDDEEEAPRRKKKSTGKAKPKKSGSIGTHELAEALDTDGKNLRVMLRDHEVEKNDQGRYEWKSVDAALKDLGFDDLEEAQEALAEARNKRLDALKERNAADAKKKKKAKAKAEVEDDEDEDEDDEEEEEAPPKRSSKRRTKKR